MYEGLSRTNIWVHFHIGKQVWTKTGLDLFSLGKITGSHSDSFPCFVNFPPMYFFALFLDEEGVLRWEEER